MTTSEYEKVKAKAVERHSRRHRKTGEYRREKWTDDPTKKAVAGAGAATAAVVGTVAASRLPVVRRGVARAQRSFRARKLQTPEGRQHVRREEAKGDPLKKQERKPDAQAQRNERREAERKAEQEKKLREQKRKERAERWERDLPDMPPPKRKELKGPGPIGRIRTEVRDYVDDASAAYEKTKVRQGMKTPELRKRKAEIESVPGKVRTKRKQVGDYLRDLSDAYAKSPVGKGMQDLTKRRGPDDPYKRAVFKPRRGPAPAGERPTLDLESLEIPIFFAGGANEDRFGRDRTPSGQYAPETGGGGGMDPAAMRLVYGKKKKDKGQGKIPVRRPVDQFRPGKPFLAKEVSEAETDVKNPETKIFAVPDPGLPSWHEFTEGEKKKRKRKDERRDVGAVLDQTSADDSVRANTEVAALNRAAQATARGVRKIAQPALTAGGKLVGQSFDEEGGELIVFSTSDVVRDNMIGATAWLGATAGLTAGAHKVTRPFRRGAREDDAQGTKARKAAQKANHENPGGKWQDPDAAYDKAKEDSFQNRKRKGKERTIRRVKKAASVARHPATLAALGLGSGITLVRKAREN